MALARAWKRMSWFYYQYLLVTALYMLEPWERTVFSILRPAGARAQRGSRSERRAGSGEAGAREGAARVLAVPAEEAPGGPRGRQGPCPDRSRRGRLDL